MLFEGSIVRSLERTGMGRVGSGWSAKRGRSSRRRASVPSGLWTIWKSWSMVCLVCSDMVA